MISPDEGSYERVKVAARAAGCSFDYMEKVRVDADRVEISPKEVDVSGKEVVIVDDIISTGSTVIEAAKMLMSSGASRVEAACVHAVLASHALNRLFSSGIQKVIATDTVERQISVISVAEEIVRVIKSVS
jgi:ribose-phosphate pyrophosphokinase